ncbi:MAG: hypothetical protein AAF385_01840 [Pseudomonadota bacterium]
MKHSTTGLVLVVSLLAACSGGSGDNGPIANQAPTVSSIPATKAVANTASQPIAFSVSDEDVRSLTLTVSSDRPDVVPDDAIQVSGTGTTRELTITPVIDTTGDAVISIIAEDSGGLGASSSFVFTVDPEQKSMQQFARSTFSETEDDDPSLINAVEFAQDADDDDFSDLLAQ